MAGEIDGEHDRAGCLAGRLLGGAARLVLVYPLAAIGSQLGRAAQRAVWPDLGTPYEGALIGILAGVLIGLSLWLTAIRADGWRRPLADATLVTVAALWLAVLLLPATARLPASELLLPWAACLGGAAAIAILLKA